MLTRLFSAALIAGISLMLMPSALQAETFSRGNRNTDFEPAFESQFRAPLNSTNATLEIRRFATGLTHPWAIAVLPNWQGFLITERSGQLRFLKPNGKLSDPISGIPEVYYKRQGGLLDVALSPEFKTDNLIYLSYSKPVGNNMSVTAVVRGKLSADRTAIQGVEPVFEQLPPSPTPLHYGSRLVFDKHGHLFVTTGEHSSPTEREYAQSLDKSYGKIVRLTTAGASPEDNPFVGRQGAIDAIWSLGHRNVQGAAIDQNGQLWAVEHGPQGGDELNLILPGKNYGWPVVSYGEQYSGDPIGDGLARAEGMEEPTYFWDPVIAPGGMVFYHGDLFPEWNGNALISSYTSGGVVRLQLDQDNRVSGEERILREIGGVRDLAVLDDGSLLLVSDAKSGDVFHIVRKPQP